MLNLHDPVDPENFQHLASIIGIETAFALVSENMYNRCKNKISTVDNVLRSKPLYSDFETAKKYYEENGIVPGESQEIIEFNDLMEFVYIGRRKKEEEIFKIPEETYLISYYLIPPETI